MNRYDCKLILFRQTITMFQTVASLGFPEYKRLNTEKGGTLASLKKKLKITNMCIFNSLSNEIFLLKLTSGTSYR